MIEVKHITKKYGDTLAVNDVSFKIRNGKIYGLLGPNGAGKSTTMNIIAGCISATSGSVNINGYDVFENPLEAKSLIGYLPEQPPLYNEMTPSEYLEFVAEAKNVPYEKIYRQVRQVMELTGIYSMKDRLIKNLSKGYKQRVGIAQAMLGNPEIIILDEPTVGLDPKQIIEIRELIKKLGESKTVIVSSHILAEISAVCDHVIIISQGKVVADDEIKALEAEVSPFDKLHLSVKGDAKGVKEVLGKFEDIQNVNIYASKTPGVIEMTLSVPKERDIRDDIFFAMAERRYAVITMEKEDTSLESVFLSLTSETKGNPKLYRQRKKKKKTTDDSFSDNTGESDAGIAESVPETPAEENDNQNNGIDDGKNSADNTDDKENN